MVKKFLISCLTGLILLYSIALGDQVRVFVILFPVLFILVLITGFLLLAEFIRLILPHGIKKLHEDRKRRFVFLLFVLLLIGYFDVWMIGRYFLPLSSNTLKGLGISAIAVSWCFFMWNLIRLSPKKLILLGTAIFILFLSVVTALESVSHNSVGQSSVEDLKSLPYVAWVPAEETMKLAGVTKIDPDRVFPGLNLYSPYQQPNAYLIDMNGKVRHTWFKQINKEDYWQYVELDQKGDLLAIVPDELLLKLDWNSKVKWILKGRFHHDVAVAENGNIYALERKDDLVFVGGIPVPALNDYVRVISSDGKLKQEIRLFQAIHGQIPFQVAVNIYRWYLRPEQLWRAIRRSLQGKYLFFENQIPDFIHINTIEIMNRDIPGFCKKGDLLISIRELDWIGVIDGAKEQLVWSWGPGVLIGQHHPTVLMNGNLLVFDNGNDRTRKYSRVLEVDPVQKKIVWEYRANPPAEFYSEKRGSSQRFPNGNTMVVESDSGHVFEVTRDGQIVWEFYVPHMTADRKYRAAVYRMTRLTQEEFPFLLDRLDPDQNSN